jgi:quercetin dioxygenase-like cupin family protein
MELQVIRVHDGAPAELPAAMRVIYRLADERAELSTGPATVAEEALCFELVEQGSDDALLRADLALAPGEQYLLRCDRVDFPPGGVAYLHTHQGPGIRVLLQGSIEVSTNGETHRHGPFGAWFEAGPDPVFAATSATEPSAFVRCMVLPRALLGRSSIRYVRDEDADKPKSQRYQVYVDEPLELPVPG